MKIGKAASGSPSGSPDRATAMNRSEPLEQSRLDNRAPFELLYDKRVKSKAMHERALEMFPGGVLHTVRAADPFPLYFPTGKGSRKWDADGNEFVDYHLGSGALLLGHQHPDTLEAMRRQLDVTYHMAKGHPLELEWGRRIQEIVPNAERIRFTNSGSEATLLAMRAARSFTGRNKVMRFHAHYHGWHDYAVVGAKAPYDASPGGGVPDEITALMPSVPGDDPAIVQRVLREDRDIAAVIVEASGPSYGRVPLRPGFLTAVREITAARNVPLIMDETISGFRWAPGGVQQKAGVDADLICMGKVLSGGMPGSATAGKADIMEVVHRTEDPRRLVYHAGTYNANPLAAAAGIATLDIAATGEPQRRADAAASHLRLGLNEVLQKANIAGCVYGESSTVHIYLGECPTRDSDDQPMWTYDPVVLTPPAEQVGQVHKALQVYGIDLMSRMSGVTSSEHSNDDVEWTIEGFAGAIAELLDLGVARRRA